MTAPNSALEESQRGERGIEVPRTVPIPAGRIELRGSAPRVVEIEAFLVGRTPVTNREYASFVSARGVPPPPWWMDPRFSALRQPVVGVNWFEAMAYCAWLSETTGSPWRLPTEAEWEFAACGGMVAPRTAFGEEIPDGEIPAGPLAGPWETGRGTPNGYGLLDVGTIVHEWCLNWHDPEPERSGSRTAMPRRASRGGSWRHEIRWSSPSARSSLPPDFRYSDYGFRVLCELDRTSGDARAEKSTEASS